MNTALINFLKKASATLIKHSPEILTGLGVAGVVTTVVMAVKQTPKVNFAIDEATTEKGEDLTKTEKAKIIAKGYWSTIAMGTLTVACFVGSNYISIKHYSLLESAYIATSSYLTDFQKKTEEVAGKKKKEEIDDAIAKESLVNNPVNPTRIHDLGNGDQVFRDIWSGRDFKSNMAHVQAAFNTVNKMMLDECSVSLNEFYMTLGLNTNGCGEYYGWNNECCRLLKPIFTVDEDTGVICMQFNESPVFNLYYS